MHKVSCLVLIDNADCGDSLTKPGIICSCIDMNVM